MPLDLLWTRCSDRLAELIGANLLLLECELFLQEIDCFEHLALKFCACDFLDSLGARYRER